MKYSKNKYSRRTVGSLYKVMTEGNHALLGMAYDSEFYPHGIVAEPFLTDIRSEDGSLEFTGNIIAHKNEFGNLTTLDRYITASGLGYLRLEDLNTTPTEGVLMADLMLANTKMSASQKVPFVTTFVEPEVYVSVITIAGTKFYIYKVTEQAEYYTHTVYLLMTDKKYDGQTFFGMLAKEEKINKNSTETILDLFTYNNILSKEVPGVFTESSEFRYNLYNTNKTGIFFSHMEEQGSVYIGCGQSFIRFFLKDITHSKVIKEEQGKHTLEVYTKKGTVISILV